MPVEITMWFSVVLVFASVVVKVATANIISRQKSEVADLEKELRKLQERLQEIIEHRASVNDNVLFYERREVEVTKELEILRPELEEHLAAERKHLESLGYDPDEEGAPDAIEANAPAQAEAAIRDEAGVDGPADGEMVTDSNGDPTEEGESEEADSHVSTFQQTDVSLDPTLPVSVVLGDADRLFLPDAVVTELLGMGVNVMERALLTQKVRELGEDLGLILAGEQYFKLGSLSEVRAVVVINSRMRGSGVGTATCRIVEIPSGKIVMSTSYDQPGIDERSESFETLTATARIIAESINSAMRAPTPEAAQ